VLAAVYGVRPMVRTLIPTGGMNVYRESHFGFFHGSGRDFWYRPGAGLRGYFRYEIGYWLAGTFVLIVGGLESLARLARRGRTAPTVARDDAGGLPGLPSAHPTPHSGPPPQGGREKVNRQSAEMIPSLPPCGGGPGWGDSEAGAKDLAIAPHNDEVVLTCALLHVAFVTLFFGHSFSWKYYLSIFLLGLAAMASRGKRHAWVIGTIAAMVLFTDKAWVQALDHDWKTRAPGATTRGLWATPDERREWTRVLDLTRGHRPVLLTDCEGAALLFPQFAPPMAAYLVPGHPLPAEVRRKAAQLASARMIVKVGPPGDRRFERWPELAAALDGCEPLWQGSHYQVYRRR
jgi:hypothetical protein